MGVFDDAREAWRSAREVSRREAYYEAVLDAFRVVLEYAQAEAVCPHPACESCRVTLLGASTYEDQSLVLVSARCEECRAEFGYMVDEHTASMFALLQAWSSIRAARQLGGGADAAGEAALRILEEAEARSERDRRDG